MSNPLIPGFSPYNVPVRQARRPGVEARPAAGEPQPAQLPARPAGRWSEPAVQVRLSREALALLNGDALTKPATAKAASSVPAASGAEAGQETGGARAATPAQPVRSELYARHVAPGGTINILV